MEKPGFFRRLFRRFGTLIGEISRRHVLPVAVAYFVSAWLLIEVASVVLPAFEAPDFLLRGIIIVAFAGFPVALLLSWLFDFTPGQGVIRTAADPVDSDLENRRSPSSETDTDTGAEAVSERRQLTVLYGALVWETSSDDDPDPEFLRDAVPELAQVCGSVAGRFDGHMGTWLSDRFIIYFGYPEAREEDARRAVRSGLAILHGVARVGDRLKSGRNINVQAKIGIDTGIAVVESGGSGGQGLRILGNVVKNAEALQSLAPDGELFIGAATRELVEGYFQQDDLDEMRGANGRMIAVSRVRAESGARSRIEARGGSAPLTGREQELALLTKRWDLAKEGQGQVALVSGEAGMGKSRLVHALKTHVAGDPSAWLTECFCSPDHRNDALYPVRDVIEFPLGERTLPRDNASRLAHVEGILAQYGMDPGSTVPLLADLLNIDTGDRYAPLHLAARRQREETLALLVKMLLARARTQPLLLVVEDLHWADATFLELIRMVIQHGPTERILIVFTTRPAAELDWLRRGSITQVNLTPLTASEVRTMIASLGGDQVLPTAVTDQVIRNAQGNPLFAEELTRGVLATARGRTRTDAGAAEITIPATLQESLLAQLDQLGDARRLARIAATFGRAFRYPLIAALAAKREIGKLDEQLRALVDAEIIYQQGVPPDATYQFKHVLLQEAAYQSLLKSEREACHLQVAELLRSDFRELVRTQPQLLATHLAAAGRIDEAIPFWLEAGKQALRKSANLEAQSLLQHGLVLLGRLPESAERDAMELDLQIALGPALMATRGYSALEVENAYQRAEELCQASEASPRTAPVLFGLWTYYVVSGDLPKALDLGDRLLGLATRMDNSDLLLESHVLLGVTRAATGPVSVAIEHLRNAVDLYETEKHSGHAYVYGQDPKMAAMVYLGSSLWWQGFSDAARDKVDAAIQFARGLGHPHSLAFALSIGARCHLRRGDDPLAAAMAREAVEVARTHGFPVWEATGNFIASAAALRQDTDNSRLLDLTIQLEDCKKVGNSLSTMYYSTLVADAMLAAGRIDDASRYIEEAAAVMTLHGTDVDDVELYRVKGALLWRRASGQESDLGEAETWLRKAVDCASASGASSWGLVAATTLAEFLRAQAREDEAFALLSAAMDRVEQGRDLRPWREARAVLEALQSECAESHGTAGTSS